MFFDNFAAIGLRAAAHAAVAAVRAARRPADAYGAVARVLRRAERPQHDARSAALRRPEDLPRRAADEAGPDEHGGVDREPRALPRSPARRVRGGAAAAAEAARLHDQVDPARGGAARPAAEILDAPEDGLPGAVRRSGCADAWSDVARDVLLDSRAPPARHHRSGRRRAAARRRTRSGAADGGDAIWSLLNLELWYRTFIDGDGVQTLPAPRRADSRSGRARRPRSGAHRMKHPLAERRPAPAARQGRQAPHVAPDAPPRRAARHHLPLVRGSRADRGASRRHARGLRAARDRAAHATRPRARCASTPTPRATWSIRCPTPSAKYRSAAYRARVARRCSRPGEFDAVVCDFLPPVVNMPAGCPAPPSSSRTTSRRRSGGGTPRRRPTRSRGTCSTQQWQRMLRFEARRARAVRPGARRVRGRRRDVRSASIRARCARRCTSSRPASTRDYFTPHPPAPRAARAPRLHRLDGLAAERRRHAVLLPRDPAAHPRRQSPDATLSIVGRAPTPAVRRLAREPRHRGHRPRRRRPAAPRGGGVYVVPLRIGGGTRLKIFEAMAHGQGRRLDHDRRRRAAGRPTAATSSSPTSRRAFAARGRPR